MKILVSGSHWRFCFDVFPNEKAETYSLQQQMTLAEQDNVIMTPHVAGWTWNQKKDFYFFSQKKLFNFIALNNKLLTIDISNVD